MKRLSLVFLFVASTTLWADEVATQFEQANVLYRNGDFGTAAELYEKVITNGYENPDLFFNLGNTYFKLKKTGPAILNYERALRISPSDDDISYNLRLANLRVVDKIEPIPQLFFLEWWYSFVNLASANRWTTLFVISIWLLSISIGVAYAFRNRAIKQIATGLIILSSLFTCITGIAGYQRYLGETSTSMAIVLQSTAYVKSSPDQQSTDLFVLHEGVKAEILDVVGEWKKIRLADGKVGWISITALATI